MMDNVYPVQYAVEYPDRNLSRVSTFFRLLAAIPILIILGTVSSGTWQWTYETGTVMAVGAGGLLFVPPLLMILFRRKYPLRWFEWNRELLRFANRIVAYLALMDDRYPSTDDYQAVHLYYKHPDVPNELNRWLPLVKWLLAIPHYVVLVFLDLAAVFVVIIAWFAILATGRYPRDLFTFVEGVMRWHNRVLAYSVILATDRYPPFRFGP